MFIRPPLSASVPDTARPSGPARRVQVSTASGAEDVEDEELVVIDAHHRHLPKREEAGFIEWDQETNVVERGYRFDEVAPLVELVVGYRDELPRGCP